MKTKIEITYRITDEADRYGGTKIAESIVSRMVYVDDTRSLNREFRDATNDAHVEIDRQLRAVEDQQEAERREAARKEQEGIREY